MTTWAALFVILAFTGSQAVMQQDGKVPTALRPLSAEGNCSDAIDKCKNPVKYISRNGRCVTFACEAGTKTQYLIKTDSADDIKALMQR